MTKPKNRTDWPDTTGVDDPPRDHHHAAARWLLGRYPRLAQLAARIHRVVVVEDGELCLDLDHLGDVFAGVAGYDAAWDAYERANREPKATDDDDNAWYRWQEAGPKPDSVITGLADLLPMSSGEVQSLRLLAMLGTTSVPFRIGNLSSLDTEGQALLADWCRVLQAG